MVATGDFSDALQLWDTASGRPIGTPIRQENIVASVAFSPDGQRLAVGTHVTRRQGHAGVTIWDLKRRSAVGPQARHRTSGTPEYLIWSPDGTGLVSLDRESADLMRVDGRTGAVLRRASDFAGRPRLMITSPDGHSLLTGTADGLLELRDAVSLERIGPAMSAFVPGRLRGGVNALAFAPDGQTVASGYLDGTVRLWDVATHSPIGPPQNSMRALVALAFRQGGRTLTSLSQDGEVRSRAVREPMTGSKPGSRLTRVSASARTRTWSPSPRARLRTGRPGSRPRRASRPRDRIPAPIALATSGRHGSRSIRVSGSPPCSTSICSLPAAPVAARCASGGRWRSQPGDACPRPTPSWTGR
jgi:WD40 repeat protein